MKYYAVRKGIKPGIYTDWDTCKEQVNGFSGAEYKSFKSQEEALNYIYGTTDSLDTKNNEPVKETPTHNISKKPYAFVDGSFNPKTNVYGYGGFVEVNGERYILQGCGDDPEMSGMRNVSGEILGAMAAVEKAISLNLPEIDIYYDYVGIEMWATDNWKCNKECTIAYRDYMKNAMKKIKINFIKVAAHTGVEGNELADKLAKESVGL